jgi:hypothetical protein
MGMEIWAVPKKQPPLLLSEHGARWTTVAKS